MRFRLGPSLVLGLFAAVLTGMAWTPLRQAHDVFSSGFDAPRFDRTVAPSVDYSRFLSEDEAMGALTPDASRLAVDPSVFTESPSSSRGDFMRLAQAKDVYAQISTTPPNLNPVVIETVITLRDISTVDAPMEVLGRAWAIYSVSAGGALLGLVEGVPSPNEIFQWAGGDGGTFEPIIGLPFTQPPVNSINLTINRPGRYRVFLLLFDCVFDIDDPLNPGCSVLTPLAFASVDVRVVLPSGVPSATITVEDAILKLGHDGKGLVPFNDWMPIISFTMLSDSEDDPAPRILEILNFRLGGDPILLEMRMLDNRNRPDFEDLLEFAIFEDPPDIDGAFLGDVPPGTTPPLLTFEFQRIGNFNSGNLVTTEEGSLADAGELVGTARVDQFRGSLAYFLNFIGTGTLEDPQFLIPNGGYVVAFRTSLTWKDSAGLSLAVANVRMFPFRPTMGDNADGYLPDFTEGEELFTGSAYLSSFSAFDITQGPTSAPNLIFANPFTYTKILYNPLPEYTRPRFDLIGDSPLQTLFETVAGEFLDLRRLIPLEQWIPLIGINLHAIGLSRSEHGTFSVLEGMIEVPVADIREVNLVFTDIGADPDGPPGNGGFNPTTDLENILPGTFQHITGNDDIQWDRALGQDFAFNGVWLWADANDSFLFEPPSPRADQGVDLDGDLPYSTNPGFAHRWEHIARPKDGGDPQWRIKLKFENGIHRNPERLAVLDDFVEPEVDGFSVLAGIPTNVSFDYFIVMRADSGFTDISGLPGDGTGLRPGADFHAFIEPRRINPLTGRLTGGIYVDSMIPSAGGTGFEPSAPPWQDDPRMSDEPWWFERTHRQITTHPMKHGMEVHDLVMTYESNNDFVNFSAIPFATEFFHIDNFVIAQDFNAWMDPFQVNRDRFSDPRFVPDVQIFGAIIDFDGNIEFISDDNSGLPTIHRHVIESVHFPYETVPFFNAIVDVPSMHLPPRSQFYNGDQKVGGDLPPQPLTPDILTWPSPPLTAGKYPRQTDWAEADRSARLLKQRVDSDSELTAMLGINLVGTDDPFVNAFVTDSITKISVAFWGPEFTPSDLAPLDSLGIDLGSGVQLWGDTFGDGAFLSDRPFGIIEDPLLSGDIPIPLINLGWRDAAEPIDIDGDGFADDINGDGIVDLADNAWVLELTPIVPIPIPTNDKFNIASGDPSTAGDDLFVVVRTSSTISAGEKFRALIPVTLPERLPGIQEGGIRVGLLGGSLPAGAIKSNPEERVIQDFIGHDMLEVNIPVIINPLVRLNSAFEPGGPTLAVIGLDISTNRPEASLATGINTPAVDGSFLDPTKVWANGVFADKWIIDSLMETFEIEDNGTNTLVLKSAEGNGLPAQGSYRIVRDPSFLEQVVVELYDEGGDVAFSPTRDLLPLLQDQTVSGVAIYRDNDADPNNTNGEFDEGIDIPLILDDIPIFIGRPGEPQMQIKFVFSSPGTDDLAPGMDGPPPHPIDTQPRLRQWVPHTFGEADIDAEFRGDDFFIVVRPALGLNPLAKFSVAIVSWGPATPSEPDPDQFTYPRPPLQPSFEFDIFSEFPWGSRALGFITFREDPPMEYWMEGTVARNQPELSGIHWTRTTVSKKVRTNRIEVQEEDIVEAGEEVVINSASPSVLPDALGDGESFAVVIQGIRFGPLPIVVVDQFLTEITQSSDIEIRILLRGVPDVAPSEPILLSVLNTLTGSLAARDDIFTLESSATLLKVLEVVPSSGSEDAFPVTIIGQSFNKGTDVQVLFGETQMPVLGVSQDGVVIIVDFPMGGLPRTGPLDVEVRGMNGSVEVATSLALGGFFFINNPVSGCDASGVNSNTDGGAGTGDMLIMVSLGLALVLARRRFVYAHGG